MGNPSLNYRYRKGFYSLFKTLQQNHYKYEIKSHEIVDWDDRSVIGKMGEEVLVVSTCYPFIFVGPSPERFIFYAYPK
nr:sortase [Lactococcus petauri]